MIQQCGKNGGGTAPRTRVDKNSTRLLLADLLLDAGLRLALARHKKVQNNPMHRKG
jgi:hypothetical protein